MKKGLTYKSVGVDIDEGERLVERIKPMVRKTFRPEVMTNIGSFNALFKLNLKGYEEPVLVSGTDGVGTKLKIAFMTGKHNTVGIDLVAMCVNDIITSGAEPLFFLDYFATGGLKSKTASLIPVLNTARLMLNFTEVFIFRSWSWVICAKWISSSVSYSE